MPNLNKVLLIGHLGRDAEVRYTTSGTAVISFSLATSETWTAANGQKQERTDWHNVSYFAKSENVAQYLTKGKAVFVEGSIQNDEWTDKDGQKRKGTKIKAARVQLMGGVESRSSARPASHDDAGQHSEPVDEDSIPF